ncbi:MAG TPA: hypothetical protein VG389_19405 [Myxococcota bacterium]|jgi:uncharacterized Ntn-hydrolase superfamily protein|nr:hypothetical protein [Myxococcota bacterium]
MTKALRLVLAAGLAVGAGVLLSAGGCGSSGPSAKIDTVHLAGIPADRKGAMFAAQNNIDVAKANLSTAEKAYEDAKTFVDLVKSEVSVAEAKAEQAKAAMKIAASTGLAEKVRDAEAEEAVGELGVDAYRAKLEYAKANVTFADDNIDLAEVAVWEAEAAFELEKMKLLEASSMTVEGVDPVDIRDQHAKYAGKLADKREAAEKSKSKVTEKKTAYDGLMKKYDEARAALKSSSVEPGAPTYLPPGGPSSVTPTPGTTAAPSGGEGAGSGSTGSSGSGSGTGSVR